jgi:hypothetical protein
LDIEEYIDIQPMANDESISVIDYLQPKVGFNHKNFRTIRDQYQQECGGSFPPIHNESALKKAAQRLKINIDSNFDILCECMAPNEKNSQLMVQNALRSIVTSQNEDTLKKSNTSFANPISNVSVTHGMNKVFFNSAFGETFIILKGIFIMTGNI